VGPRQIILVQISHAGDPTIHGVDHEVVRVVVVSEGGVVADDAEDDWPRYGHQRSVAVNTCDIVTRVHWCLQTVEVKPKELDSPRCDPSGD
jgi:hypothetical protein